MTAEGEKPVWMSKARLRDLGTQEGKAAAREGRKPIRMSNTDHDLAAQAAYDAATKDTGR